MNASDIETELHFAKRDYKAFLDATEVLGDLVGLMREGCMTRMGEFDVYAKAVTNRAFLVNRCVSRLVEAGLSEKLVWNELERVSYGD